MRALGLLALVLATSSLSLACSSGEETRSGAGGGSGVMPGPAEWNRDVTPPSDDEASQKRASCGYRAGDLPAETQGASRPNGRDIPIDHILVLMQENRSFDHYFQKLPEAGMTDVEVAPASFTNPDLDGNPVAPTRDEQYCFVDTNHDWDGVHQQINGGKMDGFFVTNEGWHEKPAHGTLDMLSGARALTYYEEADLPFYYALAKEFALADHYFCSVPGPTWPNRMYLYAASSFGEAQNNLPNFDKTLVDYLEKREIDWKIYADGTPGFAMFVTEFIDYKEDHLRPTSEYFADAAAGTLPQFAFIDPKLGAEAYGQNDEHPPAVAMVGENFTATVIDALTKSPAWSRSALFLTYDEHGGLYDHVPPPKACPPDDHAPELPKGSEPAAFDQLGVRVPMMVISPYAKKRYVSHDVYDHTSIVRFVEARFVMPALTNRDANAEAPWDMFDFDNPPHATAPSLPVPAVDQAKVDACAAIYEP
jgi:phospholipase C